LVKICQARLPSQVIPQVGGFLYNVFIIRVFFFLSIGKLLGRREPVKQLGDLFPVVFSFLRLFFGLFFANFKDGVLFDFLLDGLDKLQLRQLKKFYRLLELLRQYG
jgi:hypothetical protein